MNITIYIFIYSYIHILVYFTTRFWAKKEKDFKFVYQGCLLSFDRLVITEKYKKKKYKDTTNGYKKKNKKKD